MPDPGPALHSTLGELDEAAEVRTEDISLARAWLRRFGGPFLDLLADALPFERETLTLAVIAGMLGGGSRYLWLSRQAVYFDLRRRRVILPTEVRQAFDRTLDRAGQQARQDTLQIVQPGGSLADWELTMRRAVKDSQISATVLAEGGVRRVSVGGLIEVRDEIHSQFGYLDRFARQIEAGQSVAPQARPPDKKESVPPQPIDGRAAARADAYLQSARARYMRTRAEVAKSAGYDEKRNIRYPGDSCEGCIEMTNLGWTPIDNPDYVAIGERQCLYNCRCDEVFRNSQTGEIDHVPSSYAITGQTEWGTPSAA